MYKIIEHTFIIGLDDDIVQNHIMLKLMEPILVVKPHVINIVGRDDIILIFWFSYIFINTCKFTKLDALILAKEKWTTDFKWFYEFNIYSDQWFYGDRAVFVSIGATSFFQDYAFHSHPNLVVGSSCLIIWCRDHGLWKHAGQTHW